MYRLSLKTMQVIRASAEKIPETDVEKRKETNLILSEFGAFAKYGASYANTASSLDNLNLMSNYVLEKNNILEKRLPAANVSVMSLIRFLYGFRLG